MKLLLCSLLLASYCALSSRCVSSGTFVVTQSPDLSVEEGETVNITCCWPLEFESVSVNWLKNDTELESFNFKNQGSNCSHFTLSSVTREDSGTYICRVIVEIPVLTIKEGNGTVITVVDNTEVNTTREHQRSLSVERSVIICLAVVTPLLLITLLCFCCLRRRQARTARVIYEVPHIDSEEVEMDKHSTSSSTGSSQWCQVPVYESFDYFERVENKESE
ncbi:kin of IRRE-like protein 3 [Trematomus bernacchii]|uniref:kin of IRRE-like protein 3 n=1 Tax=Trematomus bernacchii TaxID=40690 RepID=UPI00146A00AA|nr:kin of IRRE-like protein 3 [Trematomus bernacchii]